MRLRLTVAAIALVVGVGPGWASDAARSGLDALLNSSAPARPPEFNSVHFCIWRTDHRTSGLAPSEDNSYTSKCVLSEAQAFEDIMQRWKAVDYRVKQGCVAMHGKGDHPSYAALDECLLD